jgi:cardiolipin synthase
LRNNLLTYIGINYKNSNGFALFVQVLKQNIPNYLTFTRVALIPILIIFHFFEDGTRVITASIFVFAALTDLLDGYLSRRWGVTSKIGALMDPIADKLIVITALALLIDADNIYTIPAIGIMCREVFVSGLREFLANTDGDVSVTRLSKWKTAIQMTAISMVLLVPVYSEENSVFFNFIFVIGFVGLCAAFFLTFYTGYKYFIAAQEKGLI